MTFRRARRFVTYWLSRVRFARSNVNMAKGATISRHAMVSKGGRIELGLNTHILPYAMLLTYGGAISIGDSCSVHPFTILYGHGGLTIGNGVRIAAHCVIIPSQHRFDRSDVPIYRQGLSRKGIVIEDNVWIGANCTILDGVRIGNGSIIGAGSVVTKSIPPNSVAVGVPARVIRTRSS